MRIRPIVLLTVFCALICVFHTTSAISAQQRYKVLAVMSYEPDYAWNAQIEEGIRSILAESCDLKFVYLRAKKDPANIPGMAKQALDVFREWHPDGVIASDDDAQSAFVVPYLRDAVETPVMFCGVNNDIRNYGYPNRHISGIVEHLNMKETIAFARQLMPNLRKMTCLARKSSAVEMMFHQLKEEQGAYPIQIVAYEQPASLAEAVATATRAAQLSDLLFIGTMGGIVDEGGKPVDEAESIRQVANAFGKPTVVDTKDRLRYGALCAVVQYGQEQGAVAADMLLKAMSGTPFEKLPVTKNHQGKRIINVTSAKRLGIPLTPAVLRGAELMTE